MVDPDRRRRETGDLARLMRHMMVRPLGMRGVRIRRGLSADGRERSNREDRRYRDKTPEHRLLRMVPM